MDVFCILCVLLAKADSFPWWVFFGFFFWEVLIVWSFFHLFVFGFLGFFIKKLPTLKLQNPL